MKLTDLMDRALFALSVPKCVCCNSKLDYGQKAFCLKCSKEFKDFSTRNCSKCSKILSQCGCTNNFLESHFIKKTVKCYRYINRGNDTPANALIYSLKQDNRYDVVDLSSDLMIEALSNSFTDLSKCIFTNVPRRKSAIIEHGYDHSEVLSKEIARKTGAEYIKLLKSNAKKPQKTLETIDRRKNADFVLIKNKDLKGKTVIIVDDIITSGSSISTAASLIRSLGCTDINAAVLAIAYKD